MPEGPSLVIAREDLVRFAGMKVTAAEGSANIEYKRIANSKLKEVRTWGKHLLLVFDGFTIRFHFLMFGTYRIDDRKNHLKPKLSLTFADRTELNLYTGAIKWIEGPIEKAYDWSMDVMSDRWKPTKTLGRLVDHPKMMACDALMDQQIFSGVGNIIKNEVLWRIHVHPKALIKNLSIPKRKQLIKDARKYSFEFLDWKKQGVLKRHWCIYTKKICPRCNLKVKKEPTGVSKRRSFFCSNCQKLTG